MRPGPARIADGSRRDGAFEVPAAGSRWRAGMFVLAAAGLALASGVMTGTSDAHAAARAAGATRAVAVNCPPPSTSGPASQDGNPGC